MRTTVVFTLSFFAVALTVYIFSAAQSFFLPLALAIVIGYLIIAMAEGLVKLKFPRFLAFLGSFAILFGVIFVVFSLIFRNVTALLDSAHIYQQKLQSLITRTLDFFNVKQPDWANVFDGFEFSNIITNIVFTLTDLASSTGLIIIYVIFLLIEYQFFDQKLAALVRNETSLESARSVLHKIGSQIQSYLRLKTLISFATASLSYLVLVAVGVDFPDFWAFLIFMLNFIPSIGSIIATIFPCLLTAVQFDTLGPLLTVGLSLTTIQLTIGNFIEPKIMGSRFNLSGFVIILSLVVWGQIWGVMGMFLCMPIMMIISIVLSNFPETKPIAILLSQEGNID